MAAFSQTAWPSFSLASQLAKGRVTIEIWRDTDQFDRRFGFGWGAFIGVISRSGCLSGRWCTTAAWPTASALYGAVERRKVFGREIEVVHLAHSAILDTVLGAQWRAPHEAWCASEGLALVRRRA